MKCRSWLVLVLLLLSVPSTTRAQGLGDAAARERQKRQQQPPPPTPPKVFTDADLAKDKQPAEAGALGDSDAAQDAAAKPGEKADAKPGAKTDTPAKDDLERERQERKLLEAEWRVRFANAREQLALAEAACWHEVVRTEFQQGIPVQMKVKEFVASEEYRQAKQALADLEEQFRRSGLPPGWAREQ
jgi:hypothetical protein